MTTAAAPTISRCATRVPTRNDGITHAEIGNPQRTQPSASSPSPNSFTHHETALCHGCQVAHHSTGDDWAYVACSTAAHVPVARTLLQAGKTVLLEKPVADKLNDARTLAPLVRSDSSNLMMGHIVLFNSEYQQLCDEARKRGPISYIDCVRHRPATIVNDFRGENPLHAAMVHDLYATQVLLDRAEPVHFSAQFHRTPAGAVDLALAQLQWSHGTVASFAASYLTPVGMPPRGFDRMEVFGSGWAARFCPNPRPIEVWDERAS